MKPFSLVLPCYNESASLPALVARVRQCRSRRNLTESDFHLILVDNGSSDNSAQVIAQLMREPGAGFIRTVRVPVNQGYGHGLFQGLKTAEPGIVGWTHADQQCDPEDAFLGWERLRDSDRPIVVKGTRSGRSLRDWVFSRGFDLVALALLGRRLHEINAQPKVFDSQLLDHLKAPPREIAFDLYVLVRALENGFGIEEIPVHFLQRKHGESHWAGTLRSKWRAIARMVRFMIDYRTGDHQ